MAKEHPMKGSNAPGAGARQRVSSPAISGTKVSGSKGASKKAGPTGKSQKLTTGTRTGIMRNPS